MCWTTPTGSGWTVDAWASTCRPQVWQRVHADADSARESGARGTPALFITGRLHAAGYDQATLRAALATAITER